MPTGKFVSLLTPVVALGLAIAHTLGPWSATAQAQEVEPGFRAIFDGRSLEGWDGDPKYWRVADGAIVGEFTAENPLPENTFLVWRGGEVGDFDLRLQIRVRGGNSGIQFRSQEPARWKIAGYQADFDAHNEWSGILYDEHGRGIVARRGTQVRIDEEGKPQVVGQTAPEKEILAGIRTEDWNDYRILAQGNRLRLYINDLLTVDVTDDDPANRDFRGLLALQLHQGPPMQASFRSLRLRDLGAEEGTGEDVGTRHPPADQDARHGPHKKVVFVAGRPSHGYGAHEHFAGCTLLARELTSALPAFRAQVVRNGWPDNPDEAFADADAIIVYADGGGGHPLLQHLDAMESLIQRGVGLGCLHYAVEIPPGIGGDALLRWIGGYFETNWSVNPHWTPSFSAFPEHPITRGVAPFAIEDEWYFHMRFRPQLQAVTPILSAVPPSTTLHRRDGSHSGNPAVRAAVAAGAPQHVAWACDREDGGRGFGFTGGHVHWNWGDDNFRKLVLNAIVWLTQGEVPPEGVATQRLTQTDLEANQDFPKP